VNMHALGTTLRADRLEIVTDGARLAEIGPAWDELWTRTDSLVFQSHAWISAWWQTVPDRQHRQLRIGLVWNGDRLDAVMSLCLHKRRGLRFLEWAANSYSDYEDIIAARDCPPATLQRLWTALTALGGFDIALINRLQPHARMRELAGSARPALTPNHRTEVSHRVTGDWTSGKAWFDSQSKKARQNYRRGQAAMAEAGASQFRLLGADEPLAPVLARLSALKRKWLEARGHTSALFEEGEVALSALVEALARSGILRIFVLELDGLIVAISINFVQRGTLMAFVTSYDPAFERASPGTLLMSDYIMWAFDHGLHTVDFLCGAEAFKQRFGTDAVTLGTLVAPGSLRGRAVLALDGARHALAQRRQAAAAARAAATDQPR
jgi:CelD/BcsL family acetyltransferase involved in cellulose biosynthesis